MRLLPLFLALAVTVPTWASDAMLRGHRALDAGRALEAYEAFRVANREEPGDPAPLFYGAAALNRLGRHAVVPGLLERARRKGYRHPDHAFEMGWALAALGRHDDAIAWLSRVRPGTTRHAKAMELRGRALLKLEQYDGARRDLELARRLDARLAPGVGLALAAERQVRGDAEGARRQLEQVLDSAPGSPAGRFLASRLRAGAPAASRQRVRGSFSLGGGHNDNVVALGQGVPLPTDISFVGASFRRFGANVARDWAWGKRDTFSIGYAYLGFDHEDLPQFDLEDHTLYLNWSRALGDDVAVGASVSEELTDIGDKQFRNQLTVRPAVSLRHSNASLTELSLALSTARYLFPTLTVFDRSGDSTTFGVNHFHTFDGGRTYVRAGAFLTDNSTRGSEFDSDTVGLTGSVVRSLDARNLTRVELSGSIFETEYDRVSLFAPRRRQDDGSSLSLQVAHAIEQGVDGWVRYDRFESGSNIPFFDFDQDTVTAGLTRSF
jgi:tetratricopeptide (TPR) repeat protein